MILPWDKVIITGNVLLYGQYNKMILLWDEVIITGNKGATGRWYNTK